MSDWIGGLFCVNCDSMLTNHQASHNNGVCPKCGYKGPQAATICETYTRAYKKTITTPWTQPFKRIFNPNYVIDYKNED